MTTRSSRLGDAALIALASVMALLLGCYEMGDSDIWWHLSGGRWILEHGRVPDLDPFTYGSADRHWVDIHWAFEVLVASLYAWRGIPAIVLMAAVFGSVAFILGVTARRRDWPIALSLIIWSPALVLMSWRFDPRPEIVSLFCLALFLSVLWRADNGHPALLWLLPLVQALWVNVQGLYILGPAVVAMFVVDQAIRHRRNSSRLLWRQCLLPALAVGLACFVSPYGLAALRFPLDIFPKVAQAGNPYKEYIDELSSPARLIGEGRGHLAGNWYLGILHLLLLWLPASFLAPALLSRRGRAGDALNTHWRWTWCGAIASLLALSLDRDPIGYWMPAAVFGLIGLASLGTSGAFASIIAGAGLAAWCAGLRLQFLQTSSALFGLMPEISGEWMLAAAAMIAIALARGASVFRLLLASALGFLALQAIQNAGRFALVAACVITWNLGEWLTPAPRGLVQEVERSNPLGWMIRPAFALALTGWIALLVTDRFHRLTGEPRHFSLQEQPLEFAHDAIRFAGRPGLPDRALLYDLGQTGLYDFYHAPKRKPFMDGRLEMPAAETFATYVNIENWLESRDPRWRPALHQLGDPLILLTHLQHFDAEAALITDPDWPCVYFDAIASVFVPRSAADPNHVEVNFAGRHFVQPEQASVPPTKGADYRELRALYNLAIACQRDPGTAWSLRMPLVLHALDRAALAIKNEPERAGNWVLLGHCHRAIAPDLTAPPPAPGEADLAAQLPWARAKFDYEQALRIDPADKTAERELRALNAWHDTGRAHTAPIPRDAPASSDCRAAFEYWIQRDFAKAQEAFDRAVKSQPQDGQTWYLFAWFQAEQGNGPGTINACRRALSCDQSAQRRVELEALATLVTEAARDNAKTVTGR